MKTVYCIVALKKERAEILSKMIRLTDLKMKPMGVKFYHMINFYINKLTLYFKIFL